MQTFIEHLTVELDKIKQIMFELLDNSRIKFRRDDPYSNVIIFQPKQYWDTPTETEQALQIKVKKSNMVLNGMR